MARDNILTVPPHRRPPRHNVIRVNIDRYGVPEHAALATLPVATVEHLLNLQAGALNAINDLERAMNDTDLDQAAPVVAHILRPLSRRINAIIVDSDKP